MDVSILTVTWNSADFILDQIESLQSGAVGLEYEQLIADNNSADGTVTEIRKKYPDLFLKVFPKNVGFAAANNELVKNASSKYILLLNPDMKVAEEGVNKLINFLESHPKAAIVGGLLYGEDNQVKKNALPRRFPRLSDQMAILLKFHHIFPSILNNYLQVVFDFTRAQTVDSVQGSFLLVKKELISKLGHLFDSSYYIWFEDVDLCREAKKNGYEVWFTPDAKAIDFGGRSFEKKNFLWKQNELSKSMLRYFMKWEPIYKWLPIAIVRPFFVMTAWVYSLFNQYET